MNHSLFVPTDSRTEPEPAFRNGSESVRKTGILPPLNRDSPFIPPHSFRSKRPLGKRRSVYSGTGAETLSSDSILRLFYGRMRKMNGKVHLIFRTPPLRVLFRNETRFSSSRRFNSYVSPSFPFQVRVFPLRARTPLLFPPFPSKQSSAFPNSPP